MPVRAVAKPERIALVEQVVLHAALVEATIEEEGEGTLPSDVPHHVEVFLSEERLVGGAGGVARRHRLHSWELASSRRFPQLTALRHHVRRCCLQ